MAAPTIVGYYATDNGVSGNSPAVLIPDGTIATGMWMIAVIESIYVTSDPTPPSGWTLMDTMITSGTMRSWVYKKKRQAGDTTYSFTIHGLTTSALMWFNNVADTGWTTGALTLRSDTGTTFNNVAASVTVPSTDNLVVTFSGERTVAAETDISSITGATKWFYKAENSSATNTFLAAYTTRSLGGVTQPVTIVYPNTQANNGWAYQLALPSTTSVPAPTAIISQSANGLTLSANGAGSTSSVGTITSYAWDFGDGATSTVANPTHTYATAGTYTVTLTVTDSTGAASSNFAVITVANLAPTAQFSISTAATTITVNGSLSVDSDGSIASYAWNFGDGATSTGASTSHTYAATGTYTITLTVTDNLGATSTTSRQQSIIATDESLSIKGTVQTRIGTATTSLTLTPDGTMIEGDWMLAVIAWENSGVITVTPPTSDWTVVIPELTSGTIHTIVLGHQRQAGETDYTFIFNSAKIIAATLTWFANAADIATWVIGTPQNRSGNDFLNIAPPITTVVDNSLIVTGSVERTNAAETVNPSVSGATTFYYSGQTSTSEPANTILLASSVKTTPGTTSSVSVTYQNAQTVNGGAFQIGIPPIVPSGDLLPTPSFTYTPTGLQVAFDASGSSDADGVIASYAWNFGDGATASGVAPTHTYGSAATYTVTLVVQDNHGAQKSLTKQVEVANVLTAPSIIGSVTGGTANNPLTLTPGGTIANGMWMIVTMISVSGAGPTHTVPSGWTQIGSYITAGTTYSSVWKRKYVSTDTSYTFSAANTPSMRAVLLWISGAADTGWVIGTQATRATTGTSFTNVAPGVTTQSNKNLIITTSGERTSATESDIVSITNATKYLYAGEDATGAATIAVGTSVQDVAGLTSNVTVTYVNTQASNGWAGQIALPPIAAGGNTPPVAAFTYSLNTVNLSVNASTSSDADGAIAGYAWNFGDGATAVGQTATHTYSVTGIYVVSLTVTDNIGASTTTTQSITVTTEHIDVTVWSGATELSATSKVWNGSQEQTGTFSLMPPNYTITDLFSTTPFYTGHRGSGQVWPEHTLEAYRGAVAAGAKAIELSVHKTSDGVWVCHHDTNTLRMTGQSYDIKSTPYATIATLQNIGTYNLLGPNSSTPGLPKLDDVLNELWGKVVFLIECKSGTSANIDLMFGSYLPARGGDYLQRVISKSHQTNTYASTRPRALGYKAWVYTDQTITDADLATIAARADYLGVPTYPYGSTMSDTDISRVVAKGLPVIGWEMWYKWQTTKYLALGIQGFMSSALPYSSRGPRRTRDNFASGKRQAGDFKYHGDADPTWSGGALVMPSTVTATLMGSMHIPAAYAAGGYAIDFEMAWQTVAGSSSLHHGIAFGKADDRRYKYGITPETAGYHLTIQRGGTVTLFRHVTSSATGIALSSNIATTAITSTSTWVHMRVEVRTNSITFQRLDDGSAATTVNDTTHRGQFFWLCQNNSTDRVKFRNVQISLL